MPDEEIRTMNRPPVVRTTPDQYLPAPAQAAPTWLGPVLIVGIVLAALNLRPAITSLGALFEETRTGLGMSGTVAGLITSVPALCFAVFGVTAPRLSRRFGPAAVVCSRHGRGRHRPADAPLRERRRRLPRRQRPHWPR